MSITRWTFSVALALAVSGGGHLLAAQQGWGGAGLGLNGLGPRLGENVEWALEIRDQLGLSAQQVESLQALQAGIGQDVDRLSAEITTFRTLIRAGEMDPVEGLTQLQGLLNQYQLVAGPYRLEVEAVLTPAQHRMLQQVMLETRPLPGLGLGSVALRRGWNSGLGSGWSVGFLPGRGWGRGRALGMGRGGGLGFQGRAGRGFGRGMRLRWR